MARQRLGSDGLTDKEREAILECFSGTPALVAVRKAYNFRSEQAAKNMAYALFKKPRVQRAIREMLRHTEKDIRLKKRDILRNLSLSLNRNLHDLAKVCPAVKKLPPEVFPYVAAFDIRQFHDDPEHPELVTREEVKIRMSPITQDRARAVKIRGMASPKSTSG